MNTLWLLILASAAIVILIILVITVFNLNLNQRRLDKKFSNAFRALEIKQASDYDILFNKASAAENSSINTLKKINMIEKAVQTHKNNKRSKRK